MVSWVPALLLVVVLSGIGVLAEGNFESKENTVLLGTIVAIYGLYALILMIVNMVMFYPTGQTIGTRVLQIRIASRNGQRADLARIVFLRVLPMSLVRQIPYIGLLISLSDPLFIFQASRRCLHDLIADTVVMQA